MRRTRQTARFVVPIGKAKTVLYRANVDLYTLL